MGSQNNQSFIQGQFEARVHKMTLREVNQAIHELQMQNEYWTRGKEYAYKYRVMVAHQQVLREQAGLDKKQKGG